MNQMKQRLAAGLIAVAVLTLAGCNSVQVSDATSKIQSQSAPILTNLGEQAQQLGEKASSAANNAVKLATDFFNGIKGTNTVDANGFQSGWASLKAELQTMADNATSDANKAKINDLMKNLEAQFNDVTTKINANGNIQEIKTSVTNFWDQARIKIDELRK